MNGLDVMKTSDYDYPLRDELIAHKPPLVRGTSRLLALNKETGDITDKKYGNIIDCLDSGDVLVLNDTKVIKARLKVTKQNGALRELIILEKHGMVDDWHTHKVLYKRKLNEGDDLTIGSVNIHVDKIIGNGIAEVSSQEDLLKLANEYGSVPLPPYMHREATEADTERYQTVWANDEGSVAAPTASLNMTSEMLDALQKKGVIVAYATLHVGLGTFMPIRADDVSNHVMHKEFFVLPKETIVAIREAKVQGKKVAALGTTITRTLEYNAKYINSSEAPEDIYGDADIFIYPGYSFKVLDCLITNFHAPRSTVLMLTAAFAGWDKLLPAYMHAIDEDYSFLSYGDSMIIY